MPDTKQLLRETRDRIAPPPDVLGGLERRRRHQENVKRASAATLAIAVAIVGLAGWLFLDHDAAPRPVTPKPALPSEESSWSRVQLDPPLAGGDAPKFLVAGSNRLEAVSANGRRATAWTSSDGATWTRTPAGNLDLADIREITNGGPGFVAWGSELGPTLAEPGKEAIWTSEDGVTWIEKK